jgi:hypothetical protein
MRASELPKNGAHPPESGTDAASLEGIEPLECFHATLY